MYIHLVEVWKNVYSVVLNPESLGRGGDTLTLYLTHFCLVGIWCKCKFLE